ncbi:hypothetical protein G6N76_15115 [Rhizobium daejeonense]|uniref:Uncharacterized protein n=1 Tax=Rhizobium daejeonense TaxID=240521 RepID=A0A6M1S9P1_9HYPH|nr:hypothetical protein [Rhizobium daejeonense]NGO64998.1 hypothetical protein [Rhizobium daejeonense]
MVQRPDLHHPEARPASAEPEKESLSATKARQGFLGRPVLIILLAGLVLALLVWIPAEWWGNAIAPENPSNEPAQQQPSPPAQANPPQQ